MRGTPLRDGIRKADGFWKAVSTAAGENKIGGPIKRHPVANRDDNWRNPVPGAQKQPDCRIPINKGNAASGFVGQLARRLTAKHRLCAAHRRYVEKKTKM